MRLLLLLLFLFAAPVAAQADCTAGPAPAATANATSFETLAWAPYKRPETGWAIYANKIAAEIGTRCAADTPGFTAALARWQAANKLAPTGVFDLPGFAVMKTKWTLARPFARLMRGGACPEPPDASRLATASPAESYGGKSIQQRADALAAYRRMIASARASLPPGGDPNWFTIFSGFRLPLDDDVRCIIDNNCYGVVRANCSAHRTGLAFDLHVGAAAGFGPDSSDNSNRRFMTRTLAYRWLVSNAARFGFVNYVFEPWHWEWSPPSTSKATPGKTPA
ncbi:hypothetical protein GCM10011529_16380 [Polymorphobacter glacialis]|uniref:Peptidase M15B domain-containing protein n=1 Tax=Sandarakinorhabdus glacialis TaxID=1614636 RepID=A0A916ZSG5_9SPHN|nr:D-alanyl-D-alanine carboxypeptidase family protein [Polymorphobacter glacialis]GGE10712.1 hypothetical protein GCM10011529_16380 [Polymorphobacter glacialis]